MSQGVRKINNPRGAIQTLAMESFAIKVHYGSGVRFDPMLEEVGGWISREAPKLDIGMQ